MKQFILISTALGLLSSPALATDIGPSLEIEDFVGKIRIETSKTGKLEVLSAKSKLTDVNIIETDTGLMIDGGIQRPDGKKCTGYYGNVDVNWFGKRTQEQYGGYKDLDDYADIVISAPDTTALIIRNAIPFGTAGNIGALDLDLEKCGKLSVGDIGVRADIRNSGSADIATGDVRGSVNAKLSGSGDLAMGDIDRLSLQATGSGDTEVRDTGPASVTLKGSGDFEAADIKGNAEFSTHGSGDFDVRDIRGGLLFETYGSGDFEADSVNGPTELLSRGSGDARIEGGNAPTLSVRTNGSGDISFYATAGDVEARASGSGDIYIKTITGMRDTRESGSGDIRIGD